MTVAVVCITCLSAQVFTMPGEGMPKFQSGGTAFGSLHVSALGA